MAKTMRRQLAEILDRHIRGVDGYGASRLARELGRAGVRCSVRTVDRWCADESTPGFDDVLQAIAVVNASEPHRGLRLTADVFELIGFLPYRAPVAPSCPGDAKDEAIDVVEKASDLQRVVRLAFADGVATPDELAAIRNGAEAVHREAAEVPAVAAAAPTPYVALAAGGTL
jgi:hypothetical protein